MSKHEPWWKSESAVACMSHLSGNGHEMPQIHIHVSHSLCLKLMSKENNEPGEDRPP